MIKLFPATHGRPSVLSALRASGWAPDYAAGALRLPGPVVFVLVGRLLHRRLSGGELPRAAARVIAARRWVFLLPPTAVAPAVLLEMTRADATAAGGGGPGGQASAADEQGRIFERFVARDQTIAGHSPRCHDQRRRNLIGILSYMRPSFMSALWMVAGVGTVATALALLVGIAAEWGAISGALDSGWSLDRWLAIEVSFVGLVALFIAIRRRALRRP